MWMGDNVEVEEEGLGYRALPQKSEVTPFRSSAELEEEEAELNSTLVMR